MNEPKQMEEPSNLPATVPAGPVGSALEAQEIAVPDRVTAAQAKVDAIAQLTMSVYQKAGTLELTSEESAALAEPFPDEAFKPGAAGKENLIYIEHAFLRDRLNKVLGIGQWAIIPRNRWAEPFKFYSKTDKCQKEGTRVYVEAMLVVRGVFVGEAVGSMDYYPNDATNYGDAVEGAKTASLRRCVKDFGVGLQAWSKDWCEGWWQRRRQGARGKPATPAPDQTRPAQRPPPGTGPAPAPAAQATPETPERRKARWLVLMRQAAGNRDEYALEVLVDHDILLPTENLDDYPLTLLPSSRSVATALLEEIKARSGAGEPPTSQSTRPTAQAALSVASMELDSSRSRKTAEEPWRVFPMPFGKNAGTPLGNLEKPYLFGLWANFVAEEEYQGKPRARAKIDADRKFREMLDEAGKHYEFRVRSEVEEPASSLDTDGVDYPEQGDVPF
jgi:hypothetical protein